MSVVRNLLAPAVLVSLFACSSSPGASPESDAGLDSGEPQYWGETWYPTEDVGTKTGQRIKNYKFVGFPDGDRAEGPKPVSLADYYDPTGKTIKLIHIQAVGLWSTNCRLEMEVVGPMKPDLDARKVVWIVSVAEGLTPGMPSTMDDLAKWMNNYKFKSAFPGFTAVLDPGSRNLGPFYDAAALPWNVDIDAKTMTILSQGTGAKTTRDQILSEIDADLAKAAQLR
ncbi:hypothetical protein [Labilithrix luteola]|nr:hypothetical protein [Labilithrix luteola]